MQGEASGQRRDRQPTLAGTRSVPLLQGTRHSPYRHGSASAGTSLPADGWVGSGGSSRWSQQRSLGTGAHVPRSMSAC
jgi:hypothetical protein